MSTFFRKGFCSEILWRCFFTFFLGGDFFSEVVLVEYFPQTLLGRFFLKDLFGRCVCSIFLQIFSKVRLVDIALHSFLAKMSFGTWVETISLQVFFKWIFFF